MLSEQQFIQTDLRENVEHRLEYFKSADLWAYQAHKHQKRVI